MAKQVKYTEPTGYFPKELRDKILNAPDNKKKPAKKKTTTKSKKK